MLNKNKLMGKSFSKYRKISILISSDEENSGEENEASRFSTYYNPRTSAASGSSSTKKNEETKSDDVANKSKSKQRTDVGYNVKEITNELSGKNNDVIELSSDSSSSTENDSHSDPDTVTNMDLDKLPYLKGAPFSRAVKETTNQLKEMNERILLIDSQLKSANREKFVLLLSLAVGGEGLNLTAANHLLLMDVHWNPQLEAQACDRIYGIGQEKAICL